MEGISAEGQFGRMNYLQFVFTKIIPRVAAAGSTRWMSFLVPALRR